MLLLPLTRVVNVVVVRHGARVSIEGPVGVVGQDPVGVCSVVERAPPFAADRCRPGPQAKAKAKACPRSAGAVRGMGSASHSSPAHRCRVVVAERDAGIGGVVALALVACDVGVGYRSLMRGPGRVSRPFHSAIGRLNAVIKTTANSDTMRVGVGIAAVAGGALFSSNAEPGRRLKRVAVEMPLKHHGLVDMRGSKGDPKGTRGDQKAIILPSRFADIIKSQASETPR